MASRTLSFANILKAAGFRQESASAGEAREALLLREFSADGRFVRTLKCGRGQITILSSEMRQLLEPFRAALLGSEALTNVSIRIGARDLHHSEVHSFESSHSLWSKNTGLDVLQGAGVPERYRQPLLEQIGLDYARDIPPAELTPSAVRRLMLVCSMFSKSQVLYYDRPFAGIEERWVSSMAGMLLEAVEFNARVAVITGLDRLPLNWRSDQRVRQLQLGLEVEELPTRTEMEIRGLLGADASRQEPTSIVTRPQTIHRRWRTSEVSLQAEAIHNPNVEGLMVSNSGAALNTVPREDEVIEAEVPEPLREPSAGATASGNMRNSPSGRRSATGIRRSPSGKLTKVTGVTRIKHSTVAGKLRRMKQRLLSAGYEDRAAAAMPKEARLKDRRKFRRLKLALWTVIVFALALFLFSVY